MLFESKKILINNDPLHSNNENEELKAEIRLWRAVIMQSLADLKLPISSNKKYRSWHNQAVQWFVNRDENFYAVCESANLSPVKVLSIANEIILNLSEEDKKII